MQELSENQGFSFSGAPDRLIGPALLSKTTLSVAILGGVFLEAAYLTGWLSDKSPYQRFLFIAIYTFSLCITLASAVSLFWAFWRTKRAVMLLASIAVLSWFLGSFFWVSYVFMLKRILIYPSVAEFAFQGFHLIVVIILYNILVRSGLKTIRSAVVVIPVITLLPFAESFFYRIPQVNLLYSTFFMFLISLTTFFVLNLLIRRRLPIFCLGLAAVIIADISFVETSLTHSVYVFSLDPVWFTGYALVAFSLIHYAEKGELP